MSGDQLEGEVPQAFGVTGIDRVSCVPTSKVRWAPRDLLRLIAILKVKTAYVLEKRGGGEQYACRGSLRQGLALLDWSLQTTGMLL